MPRQEGELRERIAEALNERLLMLSVSMDRIQEIRDVRDFAAWRERIAVTA